MNFAVVGDPIEHSLSPEMHLAAFAFAGIEASFERWRVGPSGFPEVVSALRTGQLDGVSVTMPHKRNAYEAADDLSPEAARSGAVNSVVRAGAVLRGFNTDIAGVRHAFSLLGVQTEAPVRILGSGGAARAAAVALEGHTLLVSARRREAAAELATSTAVPAEWVPWDEGRAGCVIVNATPLGMHGEVMPPQLTEGAVGVIDMAYSDAPTPLVSDAIERAIPVADGIDMLAGQAVEAFRRFTGIRVPATVFERAARAR